MASFGDINSFNMNKIGDSSKVNLIKKFARDKNHSFVGAKLVTGEVVQLTPSKSDLVYDFEPLYAVTEALGEEYMKNFASVDPVEPNTCLINKENFVKFDFLKSEKAEDLNSTIEVCAEFKEGEKSQLFSVSKRYLNGEGFFKINQIAEEIYDFQEGLNKESLAEISETLEDDSVM